MTGRFRVAAAAESLTPWFAPALALRHIADLGYRDVQLCASLFPNRVAFSMKEAWDLRRQLDALGLQADSMSTFPQHLDGPKYVEFLRQVVRAAPALGLRVMNVYLFPFFAMGGGDNDAIRAFSKAFGTLIDEAAACGLSFSLEPEYFDLTRNVAGIQRVLEAVAHPGLGVTYDACNLYQGGEEAFPFAYESLAARIAHVHLKGGSVFVDGRHPEDEKAFPFAPPFEDKIMRWGPLEQGALNAYGVLGRLASDHYDGVVVLEPHTQNADKQLLFLARELALVKSWTSN